MASPLLLLVPFWLTVSTIGQAQDRCSIARRATPLPGIAEASGVTISRRTPNLLWTHNDSGRPLLYLVDSESGSVSGTITVTGARVDDWEDVTAASCADGACLYVADIGDNSRRRPTITLYRIPEPVPGTAASAGAEVITASYPDGAHDAEALFANARGELFIVTKESEKTTALYKFPATLSPGQVARLELVSRLPLDAVTDADASPDGKWVALRSNRALFIYSASDLLSGKPAQPLRIDLTPVGEPQGEGVAISDQGVVYLTSESGGGRSGSLAALRCRL